MELETLEQQQGNTKPVVKRDCPSKRWCFTLNNYTEEEVTKLKDYLKNGNFKFIFGYEKGAEGTPHLQGYIECERKLRLSECKDINKRIHWSKCRGTELENIQYCSKDGNYVVNRLYVPKPLKIIKYDKMYNWQKNVVTLMAKEPDDRTIYWFWEETGKVGKSTLVKYLCHEMNAGLVEGKKNDILFCASEMDTNIYVFDFERSMEKHISFAAMEKIKNGLYMSGKYESKAVIRNSPHVICFANFPPEEERLSADRWNINHIDFIPTE